MILLASPAFYMEMWNIWQAQQMPIATIQIALLKTKRKNHYIFGILAENTQEAELETAVVFVILLTA